MRDVSRLAGVSPMTVSRTLADPGLVSEEARRRVLAAVDQLGYVPDRGAGSLSSRRTGFVALIVPSLINPNFADTAAGLTAAMRPRGYQPLIGVTGYSVSEEEVVLRAMLSRRPDAIVVSGMHRSPAARDLLARAGVPVVEIWDRPEAPIDRAVGFSNYAVGRLAAETLVAKTRVARTDIARSNVARTGAARRTEGAVRIAGLGPARTGETRDFRGEERLRGFRDGLAAAGLADAPILHHGSVAGAFTQGAEAMAALLARGGAEAVFLVSDIPAFGALMECRRRGIRVPEDVQILGFGDFEIGRQCVPRLSTIAVDAAEIGRRTGALVLDLLDGVAADPAVIDLGFSLLLRETTVAESGG
ncbi:LacI family DNA-binding transcriptional regulator [Methylobacterium platani]|uniref:Transcriptional regulator n=2 Tax=Methylobacterium platani TaxID=427683 RepID=A0A179RWW2_9HYPH|nr:LacI family DNA-binding transcriptional regulator [Methylobacterium platani]KMO16760.1 transcriptional regulator [Methylobacterium platani JCM 14648]OAS13862.1 transcriptional regulator [Methylobacterium platani]